MSIREIRGRLNQIESKMSAQELEIGLELQEWLRLKGCLLSHDTRHVDPGVCREVRKLTEECSRAIGELEDIQDDLLRQR